MPAHPFLLPTVFALNARSRHLPVPPTILVVDDQPAALESVLSRLVAAGFATTVAYDGDGALRRVRSQQTHLVVSELYVPCAEGRCVIAALARDRVWLPQLRILVHTRHELPEDDAWALAAGADGVLHKSADVNALLGAVRRLDAMDYA